MDSHYDWFASGFDKITSNSLDFRWNGYSWLLCFIGVPTLSVHREILGPSLGLAVDVWDEDGLKCHK